MSLEKIDTSYWLTKDKTWMAQRNEQWPTIEKVVALNRRKSEVTVIKQYFLKGKMPKWEKYRDWDALFRHLDLSLFLWLHPSDDPKVLKPLFRDYLASDLIHPRDVILGYGSFIDNELLSATSPYKSLKDYPFPFMGEKNIILFRILFEDVNYVKDRMTQLLGGQENFDAKAGHLFEFLGYHHVLRLRRWLMQASTLPLSLQCLYQYDEVLEWCLTTITANKGNEFLEELNNPKYLEAFQKALYCIHHFDTEKEGDSNRSKAVVKIRNILDEHLFLPEFKQIWQDIKADKIEVKDPWKR